MSALTPGLPGPIPTPQHAFDHATGVGRGTQRRALWWAVTLNTALLAAEVAGGLVFGSLALLADAAHLVSDITGLGISLAAVLIAVRPPSRRHSFGFARAEVLAAQISALVLVAAGGWILTEGIDRLRHPVAVNGAGLAAVAGVGLLVNAGSALLVHRAQGQSLNMRASFVHLATDAAGSLAAVLAGLLILGWGYTRADAIASLATAVLVIGVGWRLLRETTHVLMEGTPRGLDPAQVQDTIATVRGVTAVHHLHLWNLASDIPALTVHVVIAGNPTLRQAEHTADTVKGALATQYDLTNVTVELETSQPYDAPPTRP